MRDVAALAVVRDCGYRELPGVHTGVRAGEETSMGDSGVGQGERQDPQDPVELQRDTADSDSGAAGATLSAEQVATLVRLLRVAYPHPSFPDAPYQRTAKSVQDADSDHLLAAGLAELDDVAGGDFGSLSDAEATAAVERIADGAFFKLVHSTTVVALYDDREVWDLLGYEGPSYDKGGYLDRGFNDLDWLPAARITEYTGEPRPIDPAKA